MKKEEESEVNNQNEGKHLASRAVLPVHGWVHRCVVKKYEPRLEGCHFLFLLTNTVTVFCLRADETRQNLCTSHRSVPRETSVGLFIRLTPHDEAHVSAFIQTEKH